MNTYCFDTSSLLENPNILENFGGENHNFIIPFCVLEELDNKKTSKGQLGKNARTVIRFLDQIRQYGTLQDGVVLPNKSIIRVCNNIVEHALNDDKIIHTAVLHKACLMTNDLAMRIKADAFGVNSIGVDKPDQFSIYTGMNEAIVEKEIIDYFYQNNKVEIPEYVLENCDLYPNELLILKDGQGQQSALTKVIYNTKTSKLNSVFIPKNSAWGINAKNKEQEFALHLLTDPSIHMVSLAGRAGSGKSFLTLAAGIEQVIEKGLYERLCILRPIVSVGESMGYLPGDLDEKLEPWLQPIKDNLNILFSHQKDTIDFYFENGTFQMEALSYIRGRSIPNSFIIVDEAQNLTPNELKTILTRAANGSKIVLTGDIEQIDKSKIGVSDNGLSIVVEKLKQYTITGHITLMKGQRSPLATLCADVL